MEKSLICITTCNRLDEVRKYLLPYVDFVRKNVEFDFLIALDGTGEDYIELCETYSIPLLYSYDREGVGLSKNRVLRQFLDYEFYFFLDDDVELYDSSIFQDYISFYKKTSKFDHMSSTHFYELSEELYISDWKLSFGFRGGGYFNFYTKKGLEKVGGWHTDFAQWRRYGHTEHSYRYVNAGLQEYPFIVLAKSVNKVIIHSPDHVSEPLNHLVDPTDELFLHEKQLISEKLNYFPLKVLSAYHYNGQPMDCPGNDLISEALRSADRYFLVTDRKQKRHAKVEFKVYQLDSSKSIFHKLLLLTEIVFLAPTNNAFKHWVKQQFRKTRH